MGGWVQRQIPELIPELRSGINYLYTGCFLVYKGEKIITKKNQAHDFGEVTLKCGYGFYVVRMF